LIERIAYLGLDFANEIKAVVRRNESLVVADGHRSRTLSLPKFHGNLDAGNSMFEGTRVNLAGG
jgi:hypothetical protein